MYLHLGAGAVVRKDSIVGVFDLDNTSQSHLTRKYLADGMTVYLSQMSPQTLFKRFLEAI